jgi:hypothetical protein
MIADNHLKHTGFFCMYVVRSAQKCSCCCTSGGGGISTSSTTSGSAQGVRFVSGGSSSDPWKATTPPPTQRATPRRRPSIRAGVVATSVAYAGQSNGNTQLQHTVNTARHKATRLAIRQRAQWVLVVGEMKRISRWPVLHSARRMIADVINNLWVFKKSCSCSV